MADENKVTRKVYSPDIQPYSFEGSSGLFNTISSIFVGPIRLLMRVPHNIMILPVDLLADYASGLIVTCIVMIALGFVDYVVFHKWPLLVSQLPVLIVATRLRARASRYVGKEEEKREVNIDYEQVQNLCATVYDEIDNAIGKE